MLVLSRVVAVDLVDLNALLDQAASPRSSSHFASSSFDIMRVGETLCRRYVTKTADQVRLRQAKTEGEAPIRRPRDRRVQRFGLKEVRITKSVSRLVST
jgi:hypothetical protein